MKKKLLLSMVTCAAINSYATDKTVLNPIEVRDTAFQAHVKSISSEALENNQSTDIKDILKSMPSVIVTGNTRYTQKVYIRGLEDKSSNITIDGAKMGGSLFHHNGDQSIDAEMLKIGSIELGPNSALSGAGVINGSFVYETKDPSDFLKDGETFGGKVSVGYQSAYERKTASVAVFSKVNDKLEFMGIGNISDDGDLHVPDQDNVKSKQSKLKSGLAKIVFKPSDYSTIKFSYNKYEDGGNRQIRGEVAGSSTSQGQPYNEITRDTYTLSYEYTPENELVNVNANIYTNSQKLEHEPFGSLPASNYENKTSGYDLRNTSLIDIHKLTYGSDYAKMTTSSSRTTKDAESTSLGLYFEDEIEIEKFVFNLGLRYDDYELGGKYKGDFDQLSPKFKGTYSANDELKLRVGYGRIFRGPDLPETLTMSDASVQGVSKAQTGNNYEIGFDYDLANSLQAENSIFGMTAFTYTVDNYMHPTKNGTVVSQKDLDLWGIETIFNYKKDKFGLNASYTYMGGEETDLASGTKSDPTTTKIHTVKFGTDYSFSSNFLASYSFEAVKGNSFDYYGSSAITDVKRSGYMTHDIAMTYIPTIVKNAKIHFGVDNIFDKKYARHTSFGTYSGNPNFTSYEVGRNVKIKLSYRF